MVVKTNRGIYEVTSVDIICEKRVPFNGQVVRLVQKVHIPQELRIRSGGTERHSASN